jgi:hypothetical protein
MNIRQNFVSADQPDRDLYTSSRTRERALNLRTVQADSSENLEEHSRE